jgi:hypothetical protein
MKSGIGIVSVHASFVVDTVALVQVCLSVFWFSPSTFLPPMLHTHLIIFLSEVQAGEALETSKKCSFRYHEALNRKVIAYIFNFKWLITKSLSLSLSV